jgi:hypothetical protein
MHLGKLEEHCRRHHLTLSRPGRPEPHPGAVRPRAGRARGRARINHPKPHTVRRVGAHRRHTHGSPGNGHRSTLPAPRGRRGLGRAQSRVRRRRCYQPGGRRPATATTGTPTPLGPHRVAAKCSWLAGFIRNRPERGLGPGASIPRPPRKQPGHSSLTQHGRSETAGSPHALLDSRGGDKRDVIAPMRSRAGP